MADFLLFFFIYFVRFSRYHIATAPDDYVIQLDFRNNFNIELSPNCEYDFLEVYTAHGAASALRYTMRRPSKFANCVFCFHILLSVSRGFSVGSTTFSIRRPLCLERATGERRQIWFLRYSGQILWQPISVDNQLERQIFVALLPL